MIRENNLLTQKIIQSLKNPLSEFFIVFNQTSIIQKDLLRYITNIRASCLRYLDILKWLESNATIVGSRYFGCSQPDSDYDFLTTDDKEIIKKLEEFGFKKIIDNSPKKDNFYIIDGVKHFEVKPVVNNYADTYTTFVYEYVMAFPYLGIDTLKIQVQCSRNIEKKFAIYKVLKNLEIFKFINKEERVKYFIHFCKMVENGDNYISTLVENSIEVEESDEL